jgi:hypothetical protein
MAPRDAFPGEDEPVSIDDTDPEEALRSLLKDGAEEVDPDAIEPRLDE